MAQQVRERFGVDRTRRFCGLNGYRRLLQSGVEAVAVVNVPRFHAEHARAAIEAGCHVDPTVPNAVDNALTAVLGREAAARRKA